MQPPPGLHYAGVIDGTVPGPVTLPAPVRSPYGLGVGLGACGYLVAVADADAVGSISTMLFQPTALP